MCWERVICPGLERILGDGSYLFSARTAGDVIIYAIDAGAFEISRRNTPP